MVQRDVVLGDIRAQVLAGAQHITFGDPDFFNGPAHALAIVNALHEEFPHVTYDVTIKIEHLLRYARHLPVMQQTGCAFITSAVEAIDDDVLRLLDKGHTRADFVKAVSLCRQYDLVLNPTFVTFTPWTTVQGYSDLLTLLADLDLVDHVAPIQYAIRLLIPTGSRLLELQEVRDLVDDFDEASLCYPWNHPQPAVDRLFEQVLEVVRTGQSHNASRQEIFIQVWQLVCEAYGSSLPKRERPLRLGARPKVIPHLSEPWYC